MVQGRASYVLPRFTNRSYIDLEVGDHFGHVDLANDREYLKNRKLSRRNKRRDSSHVILLRMFTVQATETCDCLQLTLEDLDRMNTEFPSICRELIKDAERSIKKYIGLKVRQIRSCEFEQAKKNPDIKSKISAMFMAGL